MALTEKQERFAAEVAKGTSYAQAHRIAYPSSLKWTEASLWSTASTLAADPKVAERVAFLKQPAIAAAQYGVTEAMAETNRVLKLAVEDRAWGPVASMLKHKAMLNGLLLARIEISGAGEFARFAATEKAELLQALKDEQTRRKALGTAADVVDVVDKLAPSAPDDTVIPGASRAE